MGAWRLKEWEGNRQEVVEVRGEGGLAGRVPRPARGVVRGDDVMMGVQHAYGVAALELH